VVGRGWVPAGELREGDELVGEHEESLFVESARIDKEEADHYNFEVEDWHSYFVGEDATESGPAVWVHNRCKPIAANDATRVALGRFTIGPNGSQPNDFFFNELVVKRDSAFLGFKLPGASSAVNNRALGDELFGIGVIMNRSDARRITDATRNFIKRDEIGEILFDLTDVAYADLVFNPLGDTFGFFAKAELSAVLEEGLLTKTKFFNRGLEISPTVEELTRIVQFPRLGSPKFGL
jgi:intein/homing endonuclease